MTVIPLVRPDASATVADDCSEFYARYRRPLLAYVAVGFPSVDAESIVQETFCRVLAHWTEVGQMRNPWPWLAVTARNLARNNIRDNANTQSIGLTIDNEVADPSPDLDQFVETYDTMRKLGRAMRALTPLQRQLLRLLVEEGLSGAEAARRLGLSPGAGRMHLCRMRSRLTERFLGLGGELAVTPFALLAMFGRRLRALFSASRKTMTAGAPGVLASSLAIATTLGVVHIGITKIHNGFQGSHTVNLSAAQARQATYARGEGKGMRRLPVAGTTPRHNVSSAPDSTVLSVPAVSAEHHAFVSKNQMRPGRNAQIGVLVDTPAGPVGAQLGVTQSRKSFVRRVLCRVGQPDC